MTLTFVPKMIAVIREGAEFFRFLREPGGDRAVKYLIVTADDFGLADEVNRAVEIAHVEGVLTAASLMVGAPAAAGAVETARRLPRLAVGLHLALVDGAETPMFVLWREGDDPFGDVNAKAVEATYGPPARVERLPSGIRS